MNCINIFMLFLSFFFIIWVEGEENEKIQKYAPILIFHHEEKYFPSNAQVVYNQWLKHGLDMPDHDNDHLICQFNKNAECYFQYTIDYYTVTPIERISYWFFYDYNDAHNELKIGNHKGDWERLEIILLNGEPALYILSCHQTLYSRYLKKEQVKLQDGRIKIWVALGTHANYESPNSKPYQIKMICNVWEDLICDSDLCWDTRHCLVDIKKTSFAKYGGKWGDPISPVSRQWEHDINFIITLIAPELIKQEIPNTFE